MEIKIDHVGKIIVTESESKNSKQPGWNLSKIVLCNNCQAAAFSLSGESAMLVNYVVARMS